MMVTEFEEINRLRPLSYNCAQFFMKMKFLLIFGMKKKSKLR